MKKFVVLFLFLVLPSPALSVNYFDWEAPYGSLVLIGDPNAGTGDPCF